MLIVADPARRNRRANPYNALLSDALAAEGHEVQELQGFTGRRRDVDVLHVHWPDHVWGKRYRAQAYLLAVRELARLARWRRAGVAVVWTAHNTWAHNRRYAVAERLWWRVLERQLDGWTSLTDSAATAVTTAHPRLAAVPHAVVPHGHYRDAYATRTPPAQVRAALGVGPDDRLVAFVGRVKEYKGVLDLLRAFAATPGADLHLVVAGLCVDAPLREEVTALAARDSRVTLRLEELAPEDLADLVAAADLVALPYRRVLNSGTALLALSLGTPVLLPAGDVADELAVHAADWVRAYAELDPAALRAAVCAPKPTGAPELAHLEWTAVARQTATFYREVLSTRS